MPEHYDIRTDVKFGPLQRFDVNALAGAVTDQWFNQKLCRVNDCVVRVAVAQGEFHWHKHDDEDEFFYCVEGRWLIDIEEGDSVELTPGQGYTVPRGVVHRTRAPERTVVLMVEGAGVAPTGD